MKTHTKLRIAALSDLHVGKIGIDSYHELFTKISQQADVLVLAGDLTDGGLPQEAEQLAEQLTYCRVPVVGVLGNHDYAHEKQEIVRKILTQGKMVLLDEQAFELGGVGFAGVKGFGGGFGTHMLASFGEQAINAFVFETINEVLQLENLLETLHTEKKVVAMHYSPIRDTVVNEPEEIFPYLGSSRLAEPVDNYNVCVVFHGHAHYGSLQGKTLKGIPVYNVAYPLLLTHNPQKPYVVVEI